MQAPDSVLGSEAKSSDFKNQNLLEFMQQSGHEREKPNCPPILLYILGKANSLLELESVPGAPEKKRDLPAPFDSLFFRQQSTEADRETQKTTLSQAPTALTPAEETPFGAVKATTAMSIHPP